MFGVDAGEVLVSESTTEERLGTKALLKIWDELPQDAVKKSITSFCKRLCTYINTGGRHFEHSLKGSHSIRYFLHVMTGVFLHFIRVEA